MSAINVAAVVSEIGAQAAPVVAIGAAVLLILVAMRAFRWVKAALFADEDNSWLYDEFDDQGNKIN